MHRPPQRTPLFPYTTLFRSTKIRERPRPRTAVRSMHSVPPDRAAPRRQQDEESERDSIPCERNEIVPTDIADRSEEHTSELQSHVNLVCRLLLEKKK